MRPQLDHVVVAVPSLPEAVRTAEAAGFTVIPGGQHAELPTENALIVFADGAYLELLAPRTAMTRVAARRFRRGAEWHDWQPRLDAIARRFLPHLTRVGVCDLVLQGSALEARADAARAAGISLDAPIAMGRRRPDGQLLSWRLLIPANPELPFWIEDVTPREARVPDDPAVTTHRNGATGVGVVEVQVRDLDVGEREWAAWCGGQGFDLLAPPPPNAAFQVRLTMGERVGAVSVGIRGVQDPLALASLAPWGIRAS